MKGYGISFFAAKRYRRRYLLPLAPLLTDAATGASVLMFLAVSPAFYRRMLHVERDQGLLFNVFRLLALLPCLLLVSLLSGHYPEAARMAQASSALAGLLTLYLAVQLWRQGRQESRYLLLATALTPLTSVGGALLSLGLISTDLFTDLMQIQRWSPLVVILSLQVALAVRMQEAGKARRLDAQRAVLAENDAMHELQVHKIELEAQNEELRRAHAETDSSKARYFDFYDMAPVGYCTVSASGLIRQANLTAGSLLGQPRTALLHKPMTRFILPLDQDIFYQLRKRIDSTGEHQDCELRLLKKDGAPFWVRLDAMAAKDDEGAPALRLVMTNVSLRKQLELERDGLRADVEHHEARWAAAAETLGEGFWEWDMASGEMLRSRVFDAALGYAEQDLPLTADAWVELIHPDDLASNASCLQNYLTGISATYKVEMRVRAKDGNYHWIVCRGTGIAHDAAGVPTRMIGMHTDISERKQIEAVRDSTLALLKNVASRVPGMVYQYHLRVDGSSNFPYASEAIRDIYRVSPQQAFENATVVFAAIHPDDHDVVVISVQQSAADITPWLQEYRVKFDDGTVRWLLGSAVPQRQADGGTLWHGFITDITERRKTEAALAEKAQLLVTVLANSSVGIIFIRDRRQVWSNRRMSEMFGYTLAELENQSPGLIYPSVQSQEKFVSIAYPALARDGHYSTPWEMRRKDGSLLWVSLSGTSVDRKDPGAGSIWVVEDISKQRQTEVELIVANDELTFQNEEKGKGVGAALIGAGVRSAYHQVLADLQIVKAFGTVLPSPAQIVNQLHKVLTPRLTELSSFVTLALYRFDLEAGTLTCVNAGHTPGLLLSVKQGQVLTIASENLPIGILADEVYAEVCVPIGPGDSVLVYSDGITEARNADGEQFGQERLIGVFEAARAAALVPFGLLESLQQTLRGFTGGAPALDDQTAIVVEWPVNVIPMTRAVGQPETTMQALHRRAEAVARNFLTEASRGDRDLSREEAQKVLYELRVHQVELELQAEELLRTQRELQADIVERKQMEEQVHQLAFYDPLTQLANRRLLGDRLRQTLLTSKRSVCYGAVMFMDLDNFKALNDKHGHSAGDLLLVEAAARLKTCVREIDTVARFGGDEFVVLLGELAPSLAASMAQTSVIAEKIRLALAAPYALGMESDGVDAVTLVHRCTASIGFTLFIDDAVSPDEILMRADTAMYQAKAQGRDRVRFYVEQNKAASEGALTPT